MGNELSSRQRIISMLVNARPEKGISQAELARMIGTHEGIYADLKAEHKTHHLI